MSMPTPSKGPHPAHHVFGVTGVSLLSLVIVGGFVASVFLARPLVESNQLAAVVTATLVDLANEDRKAESLGALRVNPLLTQAAQAKANDMAEKGYFAHTSPEGLSSWHWFEEAGYSFARAGENLAVNFSDSEKIEDAWMASPTHRANILNGRFTEIGIATAVGQYKGKKTTFVVQMFGTPRASAPSSVTTVVEPEDPREIAVASTEEVVLGSSSSPAASIAVESAPEAPVVASPAPDYAGPVETIASSPQSMLRTLYILCALIVIVSLALVTGLEFKHHHIRHVAAAVLLLALMGGCFVVADRLVFTPPVVGQLMLPALS